MNARSSQVGDVYTPPEPKTPVDTPSVKVIVYKTRRVKAIVIRADKNAN